MDYIFIIAIVVLIMAVCYRLYKYMMLSVEYSTIDGKPYYVLPMYEDRQKAADMIAQMNAFATQLMSTMRTVYIDTPPLSVPAAGLKGDADHLRQKLMKERQKGKEVYTLLQTRFNPSSVMENEPTSQTDTSYVLNKGEVISICLRERISGLHTFHSIDILKFVFLHELAHMVTPEYEHSILYWNNFRFLLEFCAKYNLYNATDYGKQNEEYCGLKIEYNPMYDNDRTVSYF